MYLPNERKADLTDVRVVGGVVVFSSMMSLSYPALSDTRGRLRKGHRICCSLLLRTCHPNQAVVGGGVCFFLPISCWSISLFLAGFWQHKQQATYVESVVLHD